MDDRGIRAAAHVAFVCVVVTTLLVWLFHRTGWSDRARLTIIGALLEVVGILLVAMDFWWPLAARTWPRARRWVEGLAIEARADVVRSITWVRRLLGRRRTVTGGARRGMAVEIDSAGRITPAPRGKSNAQLVRELGELTARLDRLEAGVREEIQALTGAVQEMIRRSKDEYLGFRIIGLGVALVGSVLLASANLV